MTHTNPLTSLRIILAIAAQKNLILIQLDVKTAYLHGTLEENVYMKLPDGFYNAYEKKKNICKLNKSLYGLKQSG